MNTVQRTCVYAFYISLSLFPSFSAQCAKENKDGASLNAATTVAINDENNRANTVLPVTEFQWSADRKLSWEDFQGAVSAITDESAAATHCGIGFRTGRVTADSKPQIIVYNTFYVNKSWVRADAKLPTILAHEQGHFDLCEVYTRKLRERMAGIDLNTPNLRPMLERIYFEVKDEYETRQQAYEDETTHGTDLARQGMWQNDLAKELSVDAGTQYASAAH